MQYMNNRNKCYSIASEDAARDDAALHNIETVILADCLPPLAHPSRPAAALPAGSWDCHCHVFGPADRFPYAEGRSYTPPDAPFESLLALHRHLGVARAVIVQAACHGRDHAVLIDALVRSDSRYRGVALWSDQASAEDLQRLHDAGVRAIRFNFVPHLGTPPDVDTLMRAASRIAPLGWHLCVHVDDASLQQWLPTLKRLPVPFVIDHMGRIQTRDGLDAPGFRSLLALAEVPHAWVKVSGIDRISAGQRPFSDGVPFVRALIDALPDRVLWGTDWPHPNVRGDMPDDGEVVDALFLACPSAGNRERLLVHNPGRLYDV